MLSSRIVLRYVKRYLYLIPVFWFLVFLTSFYIDEFHRSNKDTKLHIKHMNVKDATAKIKSHFEQGFKIITQGDKNAINNRNNKPKGILDENMKATTHGNNNNAVNVNINPINKPLIEGDKVKQVQGN